MTSVKPTVNTRSLREAIIAAEVRRRGEGGEAPGDTEAAMLYRRLCQLRLQLGQTQLQCQRSRAITTNNNNVHHPDADQGVIPRVNTNSPPPPPLPCPLPPLTARSAEYHDWQERKRWNQREAVNKTGPPHPTAPATRLLEGSTNLFPATENTLSGGGSSGQSAKIGSSTQRLHPSRRGGTGQWSASSRTSSRSPRTSRLAAFPNGTPAASLLEEGNILYDSCSSSMPSPTLSTVSFTDMSDVSDPLNPTATIGGWMPPSSTAPETNRVRGQDREVPERCIDAPTVSNIFDIEGSDGQATHLSPASFESGSLTDGTLLRELDDIAEGRTAPYTAYLFSPKVSVGDLNAWTAPSTTLVPPSQSTDSTSRSSCLATEWNGRVGTPGCSGPCQATCICMASTGEGYVVGTSAGVLWYVALPDERQVTWATYLGSLWREPGARRELSSAQSTEGIPLFGHSAAISSISFSDDSSMFATSAADGSIILWKTTTKAKLRRLRVGSGGAHITDPPRLVRFMPLNNNYLLLGFGGSPQLRLYNSSTGLPIAADSRGSRDGGWP